MAVPESQHVFNVLVQEAVHLVRGDDGGMARWDGQEGRLIQIASYLPSESSGVVLNLDRTASGRAEGEGFLLNSGILPNQAAKIRQIGLGTSMTWFVGVSPPVS